MVGVSHTFLVEQREVALLGRLHQFCELPYGVNDLEPELALLGCVAEDEQIVDMLQKPSVEGLAQEEAVYVEDPSLEESTHPRVALTSTQSAAIDTDLSLQPELRHVKFLGPLRQVNCIVSILAIHGLEACGAGWDFPVLQ